MRLHRKIVSEHQRNSVFVIQAGKVCSCTVLVIRSKGSNECLKFRLCFRINSRLVVQQSVQVTNDVSTTNVCSSTRVTGLKAGLMKMVWMGRCGGDSY
ncbi:MAG: hypothetical protein ACI93T_002300 [Porticoccaceae bacterium]